MAWRKQTQAKPGPQGASWPKESQDEENFYENVAQARQNVMKHLNKQLSGRSQRAHSLNRPQGFSLCPNNTRATFAGPESHDIADGSETWEQRKDSICSGSTWYADEDSGEYIGPTVKDRQSRSMDRKKVNRSNSTYTSMDRSKLSLPSVKVKTFSKKPQPSDKEVKGSKVLPSNKPPLSGKEPITAKTHSPKKTFSKSSSSPTSTLTEKPSVKPRDMIPSKPPTINNPETMTKPVKIPERKGNGSPKTDSLNSQGFRKRMQSPATKDRTFKASDILMQQDASDDDDVYENALSPLEIRSLMASPKQTRFQAEGEPAKESKDLAPKVKVQPVNKPSGLVQALSNALLRRKSIQEDRKTRVMPTQVRPTSNDDDDEDEDVYENFPQGVPKTPDDYMCPQPFFPETKSKETPRPSAPDPAKKVSSILNSSKNRPVATIQEAKSRDSDPGYASSPQLGYSFKRHCKIDQSTCDDDDDNLYEEIGENILQPKQITTRGKFSMIPSYVDLEPAPPDQYEYDAVEFGTADDMDQTDLFDTTNLLAQLHKTILKKHKDILTKHRKRFSEQLTPNEITNQLIRDDVLDAKLQEALAKKTKSDTQRNERILDFLSKKTEKAYYSFLAAVLNNNRDLFLSIFRDSEDARILDVLCIHGGINDCMPFQTKEAIPWLMLAKAFRSMFESNCGLALSTDQLAHLATVLFDEQSPLDTVSSHYMTKENLPGRSFTPWEYFCSYLQLTYNHLLEPWSRGNIIGFISKERAAEMLLKKPVGTFLIRFSNTSLAAVSIVSVYIDQDKNKRIRNAPPLTEEMLLERSVADLVNDTRALKFVYPDKPKHGAFDSEYS